MAGESLESQYAPTLLGLRADAMAALAAEVDAAAQRATLAEARAAQLEAELVARRGLRGWRRGTPNSVPPVAVPVFLPPPGSADSLGQFEGRMLVDAHEVCGRFATATPLSYNHKMLMRRLHDRRPELRTLVDKLAVRHWVADRVGEQVLPVLLDVLDSSDDLRSERLPVGEVAVRSAHASGGVLLLREGPPAAMFTDEVWWRGAFDPSDVPWEEVRQRVGGVLERDYGDLTLEWAYLGVPPRLLVERYERPPGAEPMRELLVYMFDGEPRIIYVLERRWIHAHDTWLLPDGRPAPMGPHQPWGGVQSVPDCWDEVLEIARAVSRGLDFVRVDFLEADRGPVLSEMTVYPGHGVAPFPPADDLTRGTWWTLPSLEEMQSPYL